MRDRSSWSVYAVVGLSLAYFAYRHESLLPRSVLYQILSDKIYGVIGHAIDIFAILGTLFWVLRTSSGFSAYISKFWYKFFNGIC
ncbi:BCCT family transporter [Francisella persica]|uniref:BCCT family transporter n=1 Tax=Francisella persica TaxID=954 RepID=UPI000A4575BB|nr:BCCT family transporter [Francisella persica]